MPSSAKAVRTWGGLQVICWVSASRQAGALPPSLNLHIRLSDCRFLPLQTTTIVSAGFSAGHVCTAQSCDILALVSAPDQFLPACEHTCPVPLLILLPTTCVVRIAPIDCPPDAALLCQHKARETTAYSLTLSNTLQAPGQGTTQ